VLKPKQKQVTQSETTRLLQSANLKSTFLIEPFDQTDERSLSDLLKKHRNELISVIVCVHR
jgi:hypothetical protein